ncbi:MAG TPA: hypothetical protein VFH68_19175, partial [Polyangia bacterium]|nr:hypothetical protein [Polyangia bacterium]
EHHGASAELIGDPVFLQRDLVGAIFVGLIGTIQVLLAIGFLAPVQAFGERGHLPWNYQQDSRY